MSDLVRALRMNNSVSFVTRDSKTYKEVGLTPLALISCRTIDDTVAPCSLNVVALNAGEIGI